MNIEIYDKLFETGLCHSDSYTLLSSIGLGNGLVSFTWTIFGYHQWDPVVLGIGKS